MNDCDLMNTIRKIYNIITEIKGLSVDKEVMVCYGNWHSIRQSYLSNEKYSTENKKHLLHNNAPVHNAEIA